MKPSVKTKYEKIYFIDKIGDADGIINSLKASKYFVLTDENTSKYCFEVFRKNISFDVIEIKIESGEKNKTLGTAQKIWSELLQNHADRKSVLINLGGGMITDIGGFSASVFKRGIRFVNVPTTLMGMIDASIGGKCGVNFLYSKNQIGSFYFPALTIICPQFLKTISSEQKLSGFAECVKHAILSNEKNFFTKSFRQHNLLKLISTSVKFKTKII